MSCGPSGGSCCCPASGGVKAWFDLNVGSALGFRRYEDDQVKRPETSSIASPFSRRSRPIAKRSDGGAGIVCPKLCLTEYISGSLAH